MPLVDPPSFLIPTSFALLDACAVARFMKFIAAITTIRIAMLPKIIRYFGSLGCFESTLDSVIEMNIRKILQEKSVFITLFDKLLYSGSQVFLYLRTNILYNQILEFGINRLVAGIWLQKQIKAETVV